MVRSLMKSGVGDKLTPVAM